VRHFHASSWTHARTSGGNINSFRNAAEFAVDLVYPSSILHGATDAACRSPIPVASARRHPRTSNR
jgi:hypothetical protein